MLENLTAVRHIRSIKTMIDLALIATVFLPLTFIASVYGMNFQVDGGYSIALLNYEHGPEVFWGKIILLRLYNWLTQLMQECAYSSF